MRNGVAELIKISTVEHGEAFELLEKHTEDLIKYKFGYVEGAPAGLKEASDSANWKSSSSFLGEDAPSEAALFFGNGLASSFIWLLSIYRIFHSVFFVGKPPFKLTSVGSSK